MATTNNFIENPFNLDPNDYDKMYASIPPLALIMPLYILREPGQSDSASKRGLQRIEAEIVEAAHACAKGPLLYQVHNVPLDFRFGIGEWQEVTWSLLTDGAKKWAIDGLYIETGYFNPIDAGGRNVDQSIFNAMMLYDVAVSQSRFLDPKSHSPLKVGSRFASQWTNAVGDLYKSRTGFWCDVLQDHRTLILIVSRALVAGRDPQTEYRRFKAAGGEYFLEYTHLCT